MLAVAQFSAFAKYQRSVEVMVFWGGLLFLVGYVWSIARGVQVSFLCVVLNFLFPPISQLIFSTYESVIRAPLFVMAAGMLLMYLGGEGEVSF